MELSDFLAIRGIRHAEDACETCHGYGTRVYSNTSGWRGGIGGAAMTYDVCDVCWGSGDKHRPGDDLRALYATHAAWEAQQAIEYLARTIGANYTTTRGYVDKLADLAQGQANKRKLPEGTDAFWWNHTWTMLASCLRGLVKRSPETV